MSTGEARKRGSSAILEPVPNNGVNKEPPHSAGVKEATQAVRDNLVRADERIPFRGKSTSEQGEGEVRAGDLLRSSELEYLNQKYAFSTVLSAPSSSGGLVGKLAGKFKQKFRQLVLNTLAPYFQAEQEFQAQLVRHLNASAKYVDARDMSNFWELIRKIDYDVQKALDRIERINDEQMGSIRTLERQTTELVDRGVTSTQEQLARHESTLATLEGVTKGLESIVARLHQSQTHSPQETDASDESPRIDREIPDYSYLLLENRFRGSEDAIQNHLQIYPPFFSGAEAPVLEIGPGRGELLELFRQAKIPAFGIDLDAAMVEASQAKELDVNLGDGIAYLRKQSDGSLGGLVAIQVVEHLTQKQLLELFELCKRKVKKGGRVVFETINPRSVLALSSNYFRDPTHVWPLHPDTLEFAMSLAGLKTVEVKFLSPVAKEAQLREISVGEYMSPRWTHVVESLNRNFQQLNDLVYGYQDYCIVAECI